MKKKMTDYLSHLPMELIEQIYDNVPSIDILGSLSLVNKRFRLISLNYRHFRLDFDYFKKKRHFDLFCTQLSSISSRTISLAFSNIYDGTMPMKIDYFFLNYNNKNNTFPNLHSLSLSHVDYNMWMSIKKYVKSFISLTSLSISTANMSYFKKIEEFTLDLLHDLLFISVTLKYLCFQVTSDSVTYHPQVDYTEKVSSIKHLILNNIVVNLENLSMAVPALHTLNLMISGYIFIRDEPVCRFEYLKHLSITVDSFNISTMKQLLYPMRRLVHLTIVGYDISNNMADGFIWEQILINIIKFQFIFNFSESSENLEPIELDSFHSPFWLEKKHWYVGYDYCIVTGFSLLYSIPYMMNTYPWQHFKGNIVTKSSRQEITSFCSISRLLLTSQSTINNDLLHRYINLEYLYVNELERSSSLLFYHIVPFIDLSKITTFLIDQCRSKVNDSIFVEVVIGMCNLHRFRAPLALLELLFVYCWPNINRLAITFSYPTTNAIDKELINRKINEFYRAFNRLEYLSFSHSIDLDICQLLNNKPITICNVMIAHPINVIPAVFAGFVTRDWLEKNTYLPNFFYSCDELNTVSLWF